VYRREIGGSVTGERKKKTKSGEGKGVHTLLGKSRGRKYLAKKEPEGNGSDTN